MLKAVVDTNVLVSGTILSRGHPFGILEAWRRSEFLLITSPEIIIEVEAVLRRPKISQKYRLTEDQIVRLLTALEQEAIVVSPPPLDPLPIIGPSDLKFLACAEVCSTDYLVTGDQALLNLKAFRGTRIADPSTFSAILVAARQS